MKKNCIDWISIFLSIAALSVSAIVAFKTLPKERPLISLGSAQVHDQKVQNEVFKFKIKLDLENLGEHPAENLKININLQKINKKDSLMEITKTSIVNKISPGNKFSWDKEFSLQPYKKVDTKLSFKKKELLFHINLQYSDSFNFFGFQSNYEENYWITCKTFKKACSHASHDAITEKEKGADPKRGQGI